MTLVSNDPSLWPAINVWHVSSYFVVAASAGVMYDWTLTIGQEIELIWRQRWSLMTALYLSVRYLGILFSVVQILENIPTISLTDSVRVSFILDQLVQYNNCHSCRIIFIAQDWVGIIVNTILDVIMLTRLHAMYQRSRKVLISLVVILLAVNVTSGVLAVLYTRNISAEELILSGTYECFVYYEGNLQFLSSITWILGTVWEVLALCLAIWIAVKHFRELRRQSAGGIIGDCVMVLIKSHVVYFASFVAVSCFQISGELSPTLSGHTYSLETQIYFGLLQIFQFVQMFVLGPRLILSIREYHAKVVANSDAATGMTSIVFQERVHVSTSSSV